MEECLRLSDRNSILMTQINVYIIKCGSHGVPNINLSNIFTCLLVDFGKVLCSPANKRQQISNPLSREDYIISTNIDCFVRDSSHLHLTFVAYYFCLLPVIRKQWLKQFNYSVDQSALLTGFRTDFRSSVWNFCGCVIDDSARNVPSGEEQGETDVFTSYCIWKTKHTS